MQATKLTNYAMTGNYVSYKGATHIVTADLGGMVKIMNPLNSQVKLQVSKKSVSKTNLRPAEIVEWRLAHYIVTGKGMIISCTTGKTMNWSATDGNRVAILAAL